MVWTIIFIYIYTYLSICIVVVIDNNIEIISTYKNSVAGNKNYFTVYWLGLTIVTTGTHLVSYSVYILIAIYLPEIVHLEILTNSLEST